jgi:hypothetical protein
MIKISLDDYLEFYNDTLEFTEAEFSLVNELPCRIHLGKKLITLKFPDKRITCSIFKHKGFFTSMLTEMPSEEKLNSADYKAEDFKNYYYKYTDISDIVAYIK